MKKLLVTLSIPAAFGVHTAFAQEMRPSLRDRLASVSDQMFQKGAAYFIIVDALKDGVLKPRTPFEFYYQEGNVGFTNIPLPEKLQKEYTAKFQAFLTAQKAPTNISAKWSSDSVSMIQIFDTSSHLWYRTMDADNHTSGPH